MNRRLRQQGVRIGLTILLGVFTAGITLFVLWSNAQAGAFSGGAGGCGDFATAITVADKGDTIFQMIGAKDSSGVVITKDLRISGGWIPDGSGNCNSLGANAELATTADLVAAGFVYDAPNRSELNNFSGNVLNIEDPNSPNFPNVDNLIIEDMILRSGRISGDGRGIRGIISDSAELILDNVFFDRNRTNNDGGGIHLEVRGSSHLLIEDSEFDFNRADRYGGGFYVELWEGSRLTIDNSLFTNNNAGNDGGGFEVHIYGNSELIIRNSVFDTNRTTTSNGLGGGGRIIMHGGAVSIQNSTFHNNDAGSMGGGLYLEMDGGKVTIMDSTFTDNEADDDGGAIYVKSIGSQPAAVQLINTILNNNTPEDLDGNGLINWSILDKSVYLPSVANTFSGDFKHARIISITRGADFSYDIYFEAFNFVPNTSDVHVHFFFDTVEPKYAGTALCPTSTPNQCKWKLYGGSSPFTGYAFGDSHHLFTPYGAREMCILVANGDHSIRLNTGNCVKLP